MEEKIWVCKDGRAMKVCEMTTSHILNAIAMISRSRRIPKWRASYLPRLELELEIRKLWVKS